MANGLPVMIPRERSGITEYPTPPAAPKTAAPTPTPTPAGLFTAATPTTEAGLARKRYWDAL
jgi:hypothetical protein